jgi:hypothetical protein
MYCQTENQQRLPPMNRREPQPVRDFLRSRAMHYYRGWGQGLGVILGISVSLWIWLPGFFN